MYPAPHGQNDRVNTLDKDPAMKCQHVFKLLFLFTITRGLMECLEHTNNGYRDGAGAPCVFVMAK